MNDTVKPVPLVTLNLTVDELQLAVSLLEESLLYLDNDPNLDSLVAKVYHAMDTVGKREVKS